MEISLNELASLINANQRPAGEVHPLIGKTVIVRSSAAGVFAGTLAGTFGNGVVLSDSRKLYSWTGEHSFAVEGLAAFGCDGGQLTAVVDTQVVADACQVVGSTAAAHDAIMSLPTHRGR
jgi:hypothetical protein